MGVLIFTFLLILSHVSCQKNNEFIGYNDLLENSPMILWGSSKDEVKIKFPNVVERDYPFDNILWEMNLNGQIKQRYFKFYNNKLYLVRVSYGNYNDDELNILKNKLEKVYGIKLINENETSEFWHIKDNENNIIVLSIDKFNNKMVNCSYINSVLMDEYDKTLNYE